MTTREAYLPYAPLGDLKPVGDDLWIVDGPEIRFAYLGLKLPFPTRMTVVRLADGLWIHSPIAPTEDLVAKVTALGEVRYLVAPNSLHYWWLGDWARRFPQAAVHATPGLARTAKRPLPPHAELQGRPPPAWSAEIDQLLVEGDMLTEAVFFHRRSRTLILTDLIENFEPRRARGRILRWVLRLSGAADPDGKAPIDMQLSFIRQRRELRDAVRRMIDWGPERIVLAHGRCYLSDAPAELRRAFRWVL